MSKVRVDFFKPTGKWYVTEDVEWVADKDIYTAFSKSLYAHLKSDNGIRLDDMLAVCLYPEHEYQHPIMMLVDAIFNHLQANESYEASLEHNDCTPTDHATST